MTNQSLTQLQQQQPDRFGRRVAAVLEAGTAELPYGVTERLRAARVQAVARRKQVQVLQVAPAFASAGALGMRDNGVSLWNRLASALPLVVLLGGLILIHGVQNDWRASEVAEVDAALLTDDLPPSAYADPGFAQFLRSGRE